MKANQGPLGPDMSLDPGQDAGQPFNKGIDPSEKTGPATSLQTVAICSVGELFGGVERHILGLLSGLRTQGITILLLLFHDGELAAQAREQGIEPIILLNRNRSLLTTSRQLAGILKQQQIRIVHVHGYKATVFCALARYWYAFTIVKTEHGLPEPMSGKPLQVLRDRSYHFLDSLATRLAGATVCYVTEELRTHYRRAHAGLHGRVIPNGVANIDRLQLQHPPELGEDWFNLTIVGRLDRVKGHHLAIEALAAPGLPPEAHLHIVGTGPCEAELRTLAETRDIAHRVHFLGFRRDVYGFIAHCHALLMPSLHEGLPYTLLEAMALGTPIIASRVGGLAEVLQDGVTALLVPTGDTAALAQAIIRLQSDLELRRCLGEQARRLQQARYSLEAMTARYLAVYQELLLSGG
ncbi:MAG: glycosyltransferase family 4 protein [Candidatus Competibacteraceae bacterium]